MSQAPKSKVPQLANPTGAIDLLLGPDHKKNLVVELASKLEPGRDTLKRYGLTKKSFVAMLSADPALQKHYQDAQVLWESPMNARERVSMKAAMSSEAGLLRLHQLIHDTDTPPSNVIAAHQHMSTLGALMPTKGAGAEDTGSRHSITINLHNPNEVKELKVISAADNVIDHSGEVHDE